MFFLSGALYPLRNLPTWLHVLTLIDPLTYAVDPMRQAVFAHLHASPVAAAALNPGIAWGSWRVPVMLEVAIVLGLGVAMLVVATVAMLAPSAGADQLKPARSSTFNAFTYRQQHGYLPLRGVRTLQLAKAHAAAMAGASPREPAGADGSDAGKPGIGAKWE